MAKEEADLFAPHGRALPARARDTHRFAKLQRTPVSRLDSARHVSAGSLVPGEAPGAQEGLKGHWQRGNREAKGHVASSVQGESTKHGYGRPTSLDLCPCPVATVGCVLIQVGDEDEYSAPETKFPVAWCLLRPPPLAVPRTTPRARPPALPTSQQASLISLCTGIRPCSPPLTSVSPSDCRTFDLHPQLSHEAAGSSREPRQELGPEGSFARRTFSFRKKDSAKGLKLGACSETGAIQQMRRWEGGKSPDKTKGHRKGQANTPPQVLPLCWVASGRSHNLSVCGAWSGEEGSTSSALGASPE